MGQREQYPRSPLVYVACEIQYPIAPRANRDGTFESLAEAFSDVLPIPEQEEQAILVAPGEAMQRQKLFRFVSGDRTRSVSVARSAVTIETTDYPGWDDFIAQVRHAVEVVSHALPVAGLTRVGLRYVNEIRVTEPVEAISDWARWITPSLIAPVRSVAISDPGVFQAVIQSRGAQSPDGDQPTGPALTVRYGAVEGPGVVSDQPLKKVRQRGSGPFFLIDADSFEVTEAMPDFSNAVLEPILETLHQPLDDVFEAMITEGLRQELRRES